jgi:hypothetical protein
MESSSKSQLIEKISLAILMLLCAVLVFYRIQDADFFWHIANGKAMLEQGRIINEEIFSYTRSGVRFSNHEWLSQILFYFTYKTSGTLGVVLLKCIITAFIAFFTFKTARMVGAGISLSFLLVLVALLAGVARYRERPEIFSLLFISLLQFILYGIKTNNLHRRLVFIIPILMVLWDVMHGAIYGLVILSAFVLSETITSALPVLARNHARIAGVRVERKYLKTIWTGYLITLGAMVINPYGIRAYDIFIEFLTSNKMVFATNEFTPPTLTDFPLFWLLFVLVTVLTLISRKDVDLAQMSILVPFAALALKYNRITVVFELLVIPVLAYYASRIRERLRGGRPLVIVSRALYSLTLTLVLFYVIMLKFAYADNPMTFGYNVNGILQPIGVTRFIEQSGLKGNMYNPGHFGGYFAYHLYPERKIFMYNHHVIFRDFPSIIEQTKFLDDFNIQFAVLERYWGYSRFYATVFKPQQWIPVFWDESAVIVVRNVPDNYSFIQAHRLRYFLPNEPNQILEKYASNPDILPDLIKEMGQCLAFYHNKNLADYLGYLIMTSAIKSVPEEWLLLVETALQYNCQSAYLWTARGWLHINRGDHRKAETFLKQAVSLDDTMAMAWKMLAYIAYSEGRPSEAETFENAALRAARP